VYPDQTGEWFFRDAAKNITRHASPYGAEEQFTWDARDNLRRASRYSYNQLGRLTWAQSSLEVETFAFDPASNLLERDTRDENDMGLSRPKSRSALLDNLLKDYAGTYNDYDALGRRIAKSSEAQAVREEAIALLDQPVYVDYYRQDEAPLWFPPPQSPSIYSLAWYQADHLGTPMELTDEHGEVA
jgi:YD repeat-containing protein